MGRQGGLPIRRRVASVVALAIAVMCLSMAACTGASMKGFGPTQQELELASRLALAFQVEWVELGLRYHQARPSPLDGMDEAVRRAVRPVAFYAADGNYRFGSSEMDVYILSIDGQLVIEPSPAFVEGSEARAIDSWGVTFAYHGQELPVGVHTLLVLDPETGRTLYNGEVLADGVHPLVLVVMRRADVGDCVVRLYRAQQLVYERIDPLGG